MAKNPTPKPRLKPPTPAGEKIVPGTAVANDIKRLADSAQELVKIQSAFLISFQYLKESLTGAVKVAKIGRIQNIKTGKFASQRELLTEEFIKKLSLLTAGVPIPSTVAPPPAPTPTTTPTPVTKPDPATTPTPAPVVLSTTPSPVSTTMSTATPVAMTTTPAAPVTAPTPVQTPQPMKSTKPSKTPLQSIDLNVKKILDIAEKESEERERERDKVAREKKPGLIGKLEKFLGIKPEAKQKKKEEGGGFLSSLGDLARGIGKAAIGFGIGILAIAGSLFIAAKAFQEFANVKWEGFLAGVGALAALVGAVLVLKKMKADRSMLEVGLGMVGLASSMWILAKAIEAFQTIQWTEMGKAGLVLVALVGAVRLLGENARDMRTVGAGMLLLSGALFAMSYSIEALGKLNWEQLGKSGLVLFGLAGAIRLLGETAPAMLKIGGGMLLMAGALFVMGKSLMSFEDIEWETLGKAAAVLTGFTAAVVGLGLFIDSGAGAAVFVAGVAGFASLAATLGLLGIAMKAVAWGMDGLVKNLERLAELSGDNLKNVASGLREIGSALLGFGAKSFFAGIANFFGGDGPIDKLERLAKFGPELEKTAASLEKINAAMKMKFDDEQLENQTQQLKQLERISETAPKLDVVASNIERILKSLRDERALQVAYTQPDDLAIVKLSPKLSAKDIETGGVLDTISRGIQRAKESFMGGGNNVIAPVTNNVVTTKGPTNNIVQGMPSTRSTESSWGRWQYKNYVPS